MGSGSNLTQPALTERIAGGYAMELAGGESFGNEDYLGALLTLMRIPSDNLGHRSTYNSGHSGPAALQHGGGGPR